MSAAYGSPETSLAGLRVTVSFVLENQSRETWRPEAGFAIGSHLFERETLTLLDEGPRTVPARDIAPGQTEKVEVTLELPPEPGRYRIYVSPMVEGEAWFYERGCPFVVVDAVVDVGVARIRRTRVATAAQLRTGRLWRSLTRVFTLPFQSIWRNRSLMRSMVRRDILGRYRGSFGGWFWTILNPLLLMLTYFFVFGVVLNAKFGTDPSRTGFALYFLAGMLPWLAFSEAVGRSPVNMLEYRTFIKKLRFPVETLPVNLMLSGLVSEAFGLLIFLIAFVAVRGALPVSVVWLPALIVPQMLLTAGLCWFLAALGVFVRDLAQINGFLLTILFFLTPICYSEAGMPAAAKLLLKKNPIYVLVAGYRAVFLEGRAPDLGPMWKLWVLSIIVFLAGHAWFYKLRKSFADII
ncbi:MAG: type transporter [Bryobacterales bacterium]|nr:type transporter [Bryobacterales bacterium]